MSADHWIGRQLILAQYVYSLRLLQRLGKLSVVRYIRICINSSILDSRVVTAKL